MNLIIVVSGNLGSGKTTVSKILAEKTGFRLVCGDEIRNSLFKKLKPPKAWTATREELRQRAKRARKTIIIDYVFDDEDILRLDAFTGKNSIGFYLEADANKLFERRKGNKKRILELKRAQLKKFKRISTNEKTPERVVQEILKYVK